MPDIESLLRGVMARDRHPSETSAYMSLRAIIPGTDGSSITPARATEMQVFNRNVAKTCHSTSVEIQGLREELKELKEFISTSLKETKKRKVVSEVEKLQEAWAEPRRSARVKRS